MGDKGLWNWQLYQLLRDSVKLELKLRDRDELLFLATPKAPPKKKKPAAASR